MATAPGAPYSQVQLAADRDSIDLDYRNRGYDSVVVEPTATPSESGSEADILVSISEGPQLLVDRIIIVGNTRTRTETIERELLLKSGGPLGYTARIESQQRLSALGLFRRVTIEEIPHGSEPRRDVLVRVEEAPPTTVGVGGGLEGGSRLQPTGPDGSAEERFEIVPRAFFEVGRRNLWGKNRAVNLFTRVSLRSRIIAFDDNGVRLAEPAPGNGFNEYRVFGTYREPKIFNTRADVLLTGIIDQAIRSSFNFITREARAEVGLRLSQRYSLAGRYSFERTELFDEKFTPDEQPLIDRLFPQVRLSKLSGSVIRDTRDEQLDPARGTFVIVDGTLATRSIGSEVGFVKTFLQGFAYHRLPAARRIVLATGARLGAAHGFEREGPNGEIVQDLPASERFFAGGDTTVRGFSLDRLGNEDTITPTGFPTGGNGEIVLNAELRVALVRSLAGALFLDAGNVFLHAGQITLTDLRPAAGFGLRYRSPVGPLRVDLGFNLDRRELVPGRLERSPILHISLGQAF
jgi:outer membrane protein assembly factor BamA